MVSCGITWSTYCSSNLEILSILHTWINKILGRPRIFYNYINNISEVLSITQLFAFYALKIIEKEEHSEVILL